MIDQSASTSTWPTSGAPTAIYDVVIVGAGFGGLYALHVLRARGLAVTAIEAGDDIGGTWFWNRYPGARCDIESFQYSYSFSPEIDQEWNWTERYATQPEILRYIDFVADKLDLRRSVQLSTSVESLVFREVEQDWCVSVADGRQMISKFIVMATGGLSSAQEPLIPGRSSFMGEIVHSAQWPADLSLSNKSVGVIGTGSTGIQIISTIASQVKHLTVFQRTANFSMPAKNRPLGESEIAEVKQRYPSLRAAMAQSRSGIVAPYSETYSKNFSDIPPGDRDAELERLWEVGGPLVPAAFADVKTSQRANAYVADWVRNKIRAKVADQQTADLLLPRTHPIGTKRPCVDINYFETYNRANVTLVDINREPISEIVSEGIATSESLHKLDVIVFATGFDAVTGSFVKIDVQGIGGIRLAEHWRRGPRTYLGMACNSFPNLFLVAGPQCPALVSNVVVAIELQVEWIAECIDFVRGGGHRTIEASAASEDEWCEHIAQQARGTLYLEADSWYLGANTPGKPRRLLVDLEGLPEYKAKCQSSAASGYAGFELGGG